MPTLFTRIINGEIPSQKVFEDDAVVAFRDVNPVAPKHILVVPRQEITRLDQVTDDDEALLGRLLRTAAKVAAQEGLKDYRLVINNGAGAGQSVFHLHVHILGGRPLSWPPG
ncbi:MAG: histidine triad nucleotide-binding protein [Myxococcales bacterium]|nr:histidine triad nucleotide-binding protein [Myxococcales bacterium]